MRFRSTWVLLAIAAVAFGYYFIVEQPRHRRRLDRQENRARLTRMTADLVSRIVIQRPEDTLEFSRKNGEWRMLLPVEDAADQGKVNVLVRTITNARIDDRLSNPDSLARYGLEPPAAVVTLLNSGGEPGLRIRLGRFNLTKDSCYGIRRDESEVLLLPAGLRHVAVRDVFDYRDKRIASFAVDSAYRIRIDAPGGESDWRKQPAGPWYTLQHGDTIRGDATELENILRRVRGLRAKRIRTLQEAAAQFEHPAGRLSVWLTGDSLPVTFVASEETSEGCYMHRTGATRVDLVDHGVLGIFTRQIDELRDRHAVHFDAALLTRITIETDNRRMSITRLASSWEFPNPEMGAIDQAAVATFLRTLESLKFRRIVREHLVKGAAGGVDPPAYRLTLFGPGEEVADELRAGALDPERRTRFATSRSSRHLAIIDDEPLSELEHLFEAFKTP